MPFRILALSGGGYMGLFTAQVLARIESHIGRPIGTSFDLIAGTSIGGIIALGLALEIPAERIGKAFADRGELIFSGRSKPHGLLSVFDVVIRAGYKAKYSGVELRNTLEEMFGAQTLLGNAKHPVIVPTVNMTRGEVQMFKTPHHPILSRDHALSIVDVAMATSAAPTYFPLAQVGDWLCADGGLYANAPDLCALHEAVKFFGVDRDDIEILSIGTTTAKFSLSHKGGANLGVWRWMSGAKLFSTIIAAQQQLTDQMLKHELGDRYLRIDEVQSPEQAADLGLDVANEAARKTIRGLANGAFQKALGNPKIEAILAANAPAGRFFHGPNKSEG